MPRSNKKQKETFTIPIKYKHIPSAKHNSVQLSFTSFSNPFRVSEMLCGCKREEIE